MLAINVEAKWFWYNGQYYWGSIDCDVFSKGGGPKGDGLVSCELLDAQFAVYCVNPNGHITGEGVPSRIQGPGSVSVRLSDADNLGSGKQVSTISLNINSIPDHPDEIGEGNIGDMVDLLGEEVLEICSDQNNFYPGLAILTSVLVRSSVAECDGDIIVDDGNLVCDGILINETGQETVQCSIPEEYTSPETYFLFEPGTELECAPPEM